MKNQLETFIENYPLTKVTLYPEFAVYKVGGGLANQAAKEANELIEKLDLQLVAIANPSVKGNTFSVQSNEIGYV